MEHLLKKKEELESRLEECKRKHAQQIDIELQALGKFEGLQEKYKTVHKHYSALRETMKSKKAILNDLRSQVKKYKQNRSNEVKDIYMNNYKNVIDQINNISWVFNMSIFDSFDKYKEIANSNIPYRNLRKSIDEFIMEKKTNLKKCITDNIVSINEIHKIIYTLKILVKYEMYFCENIFDDIIHEYLYKGYEYHFMSDKETNRLDKSEWVFTYLLGKLDSVQKVTKIYHKLKTDESLEVYDTKHHNEANTAFLRKIIKDVNLLIFERIKSIDESDSQQKRAIFIDFNYHLQNYIKAIQTKYDCDTKNVFVKFETRLINEEKNHLFQKVQDVHGQSYTEWFSSYQNILRECFDLSYKHLNVSPEYVLDIILEYNTIFIDSMRYINRKEISMLIYLFNMFENLKETEFYLHSTVDLSTHARSNSFEESRISKHIECMFYKITDFNLENYKLIKNLFENDLSNLLSIKIHFINDLTLVLEEYKSWKWFCKLKEYASAKVDTFLLQNILLQKKLDKDEFMDMLELYKRLKTIFEIKKWRSRECMKSIKGYYENKEIVNEYSHIVQDIYN